MKFHVAMKDQSVTNCLLVRSYENLLFIGSPMITLLVILGIGSFLSKTSSQLISRNHGCCLIDSASSIYPNLFSGFCESNFLIMSLKA